MYVSMDKTNKFLTIFCVILLATNIVTFFYYKTGSASLSKPSYEYSLIDPAREFIPQSDYIINIQPLRNYLIELNKQIGDQNISLYYEQLNSGANISINKDLRLF